MLDLAKQIKEWCNEYNLNLNDIMVEYSWIDSHTLGKTSPRADYSPYRRWSKITITDVFKDYDIASKTVLWHEFCHAEVWIKEGKTEGHGDRWVGRLWRKPLLALSDYIYTNILFLFLRHK